MVEVEAVIHQGEAYAPSFYVLLAVAALIGAVGILTNSQILIAGAMVVGPEYTSRGEAGGSAEQLLLNVVLLIVVGAAGLRTQRAIWRRHSAGP